MMPLPYRHASHLRSEIGAVLWWRISLRAGRGLRTAIVELLLALRRDWRAVRGSLLELLLRNRWLELGRSRLCSAPRVVGIELFALAKGMVHGVIAHDGWRKRQDRDWER